VDFPLLLGDGVAHQFGGELVGDFASSGVGRINFSNKDSTSRWLERRSPSLAPGEEFPQPARGVAGIAVQGFGRLAGTGVQAFEELLEGFPPAVLGGPVEFFPGSACVHDRDVQHGVEQSR
jgi:hypothetical protein